MFATTLRCAWAPRTPSPIHRLPLLISGARTPVVSLLQLGSWPLTMVVEAV
jgi:hypothetical protein